MDATIGIFKRGFVLLSSYDFSSFYEKEKTLLKFSLLFILKYFTSFENQY